MIGKGFEEPKAHHRDFRSGSHHGAKPLARILIFDLFRVKFGHLRKCN